MPSGSDYLKQLQTGRFDRGDGADAPQARPGGQGSAGGEDYLSQMMGDEIAPPPREEPKDDYLSQMMGEEIEPTPPRGPSDEFTPPDAGSREKRVEAFQEQVRSQPQPDPIQQVRQAAQQKYAQLAQQHGAAVADAMMRPDFERIERARAQQYAQQAAQQSAEQRSLAGDVGASIARGTSATVGRLAGGAEAAGELAATVAESMTFGAADVPNPLAGISDAPREAAQWHRRFDPKTEAAQGGVLDNYANPQWWLESAPEVIPQLGLQIGAGLASGGFTLPLTLGGAEMAGGAYGEAVEDYTSQGIPRDEASRKALPEAALVGTVGAALDRIPMGEILNRSPVIRTALRRAARGIISERGIGAVAGATSEFVTETMQSATEQLAARGFRDESIQLQQFMDQALTEGALGGVAGGTLGATIGAGPQQDTQPSGAEPDTVQQPQAQETEDAEQGQTLQPQRRPGQPADEQEQSPQHRRAQAEEGPEAGRQQGQGREEFLSDPDRAALRALGWDDRQIGAMTPGTARVLIDSQKGPQDGEEEAQREQTPTAQATVRPPDEGRAEGRPEGAQAEPTQAVEAQEPGREPQTTPRPGQGGEVAPDRPDADEARAARDDRVRDDLAIYQRRAARMSEQPVRVRQAQPDRESEQEVRRIAESVGADVQFVENEDGSPLPMAGMASQSPQRLIYIDRNAGPGQQLEEVFVHEFVHDLQANEPDIAEQLHAQMRSESPNLIREAVEGYAQDLQREAAERGGAPGQFDPEAEGPARAAEDVARFVLDAPPARVEQIANEQPGLIRRAVDAIVRTMRRMGMVSQNFATRAEQIETARLVRSVQRAWGEAAQRARQRRGEPRAEQPIAPTGARPRAPAETEAAPTEEGRLRSERELRETARQPTEEPPDAVEEQGPAEPDADVRQPRGPQERQGQVPAQEGGQGVRQGRQAEAGQEKAVAAAEPAPEQPPAAQETAEGVADQPRGEPAPGAGPSQRTTVRPMSRNWAEQVLRREAEQRPTPDDETVDQLADEIGQPLAVNPADLSRSEKLRYRNRGIALNEDAAQAWREALGDRRYQNVIDARMGGTAQRVRDIAREARQRPDQFTPEVALAAFVEEQTQGGRLEEVKENLATVDPQTLSVGQRFEAFGEPFRVSDVGGDPVVEHETSGMALPASEVDAVPMDQGTLTEAEEAPFAPGRRRGAESPKGAQDARAREAAYQRPAPDTAEGREARGPVEGGIPETPADVRGRGQQPDEPGGGQEGEARWSPTPLDELDDVTAEDISSDLWESHPSIQERYDTPSDFLREMRDLVDQLTVPVGRIDVGSVDIPPGRVSQAAVEKYRSLSGSPPPVVTKNGEFYDGAHRVVAAKQKGMRTIPAADIAELERIDWGDFLDAPGDTSGQFAARRGKREQGKAYTPQGGLFGDAETTGGTMDLFGEETAGPRQAEQAAQPERSELADTLDLTDYDLRRASAFTENTGDELALFAHGFKRFTEGGDKPARIPGQKTTAEQARIMRRGYEAARTDQSPVAKEDTREAQGRQQRVEEDRGETGSLFAARRVEPTGEKRRRELFPPHGLSTRKGMSWVRASALGVPLPGETRPKLAALIRRMRRHGWQGPPLLVAGNQAITGTHRLRSAEIAGVEDIPVYDLEEQGLTEGQYEQVREAGDNADKVSVLRDLGYQDAADLMAYESEQNERADAEGVPVASPFAVRRRQKQTANRQIDQRLRVSDEARQTHNVSDRDIIEAAPFMGDGLESDQQKAAFAKGVRAALSGGRKPDKRLRDAESQRAGYEAAKGLDDDVDAQLRMHQTYERAAETGMIADVPGEAVMFAVRRDFNGRGVMTRRDFSEPFFSPLQEAVKAHKSPDSRQSAKQFMGWLKKQNGVKAEELRWTGLEEWAQEQEKFTPNEALAFLQENEVKIEEVVRSGSLPTIDIRETERIRTEDGEEIEVEDNESGEQFVITIDEDAGNVSVQGEGGRLINADAPPNNQSESDAYEAIESYLESKYGSDKPEVYGPESDKDYTTPGGENYREVLLTLPRARRDTTGWTAERTASGYVVRDAEGNQIDAVSGDAINSEQVAIDRAAQASAERETPPFWSSHFDEPNIVAHVRMNDRIDPDGRRVLFIEEVQSDWAKEAREKGISGEGWQPSLDVQKREDGRWDIVDEGGTVYLTRPTEAEARNNIPAILGNTEGGKGVPDAPFIRGSGWLELAMKRVTRFAAEEGYDTIAWTTGDQQVERYGEAIQKNVQEIAWTSAGLAGEPGDKGLDIHTTQGSTIRADVDSQGIVMNADSAISQAEGKPLEDLVGKDIARQVLEQDRGRVSGGDLRIGGQWAYSLYDTMIPNFMRKFGKKWNMRVGDAQIDEDVGTAHAATVTDAMKQSIPYEGVPLFAVRRQRYGSGADTPLLFGAGMPAQTWIQRKKERWINALDPAKQAQRFVAERGVEFGEETPYSRLERYQGIAQEHVRRIFRQYGKPIRNTMRKAGIGLQDFDDALIARHARERNERMAEINPDFRDKPGSGMSTETAQEINEAVKKGQRFEHNESDDTVTVIPNTESKTRAKAYRRLFEIHDDLQKHRLDVLEESQLMSGEVRQALDGTYDHYTQLKTADIELPEGAYEQEKVKQAGSGIQRALGRRSKASSPLSFAFVDINSAIIRAEANKGRKKFADEVIRPFPDPKVWQLNKANRQRRYNENTGLVEWVADRQMKENQFAFYENGKRQVVTLAPEHANLARAMRKLGPEDVGRVTRLVSRYTRFLANMVTRWNPAFPTFNLLRDVGTGVIHMTGEHGLKMGARSLVRVPHVLGVLTKLNYVERVRYEDVSDSDSKTFRMMKQLRQAGMEVPYLNLESVNKTAKSLEREVRDVNANAPRQAWRGVRYMGRLMESLNDAVENSVRYSVAMTLLENGYSVSEAASYGRNATTNFAQRGINGSAMSAWWMFSNAGIQGTYRMLQAHKSRGVQAVTGAIVAGGFMNGVVNAMLSDEDDDGIKHWDKVPDWEKHSNWIAMIGNGRRVSMPAPYGYRFFHAIGIEFGRHFTNQMRERAGEKLAEPEERSVAASAAALADSALDSFNPLGGKATLAHLVAPTIADPIIDVSTNRDWAGRQIYPDQPAFQPDKPPSQLYFPSVTLASKSVTDWMHQNLRAGGQPGVDPGFVEISPEVLDHMGRFIGGGLGQTAGRIGNVVNRMASGREVGARTIPVFRRLFARAPEWRHQTLFRDYSKRIRLARKAVKVAREKGDPDQIRSVYKERKHLLALHDYANSVRQTVNNLESRKEAIEDEDEKKQIEERIQGIYADFNRRAVQLEKR